MDRREVLSVLGAGAAGFARHRDVAGEVRPPHGGAVALQVSEQARVRVPVVVARTDADQHRPRPDGSEELR